MINRSAITYLQDWSKRESRKPLIIRGARQVGKSTLVEMFAKEFDTYIKLNLDKKEDKKLFDTYQEIDKLIEAIFFHKKKNKKGRVLIFIDEIQNSTNAMQMLRYFYEDYPELFVIAAGSLLETVIDRKISFPVGRVEFLAIHPCSFLEYLDGIGENFDKEAVLNLKGDLIHDRLIYHFRKYCIVGGMPEAINEYSRTKDFNNLDRIYDALLASYSDDVEKYAPNETQVKVVRHILESGFQKGAEIITMDKFGNGNYRTREISEGFNTLEKAMLMELIYPTTNYKLPPEIQKTRRPKLIWLDTGLVNYRANVREEIFSVTDISDAYRGRIAEHIVAQELVATETRVSERRKFWTCNSKNSSAEIDFLHIHQPYMIPIEVKSGSNAHMKSMHIFMKNAPHDIGIRVWSNPMQIDIVKNYDSNKTFRLISIPFYYVGMIDKILEKNI